MADNTMLPRPQKPAPKVQVQAKHQDFSKPSSSAPALPTNRDKFENKPMPELPLNESPAAVREEKRSAYIQPATSLRKFEPHPKKRAVTQPVQETAKTVKKESSFSQLRRKISFSKPAPNADEEVSPPLPTHHFTSEHILTLGDSRPTTPLMAIRDTFSLGDLSDLTMENPARDHPKASDRNTDHSIGIMGPQPYAGGRSFQEARGYQAREPKLPAYGSVGTGKFGVVHPGPIRPSESFHGIIGDTADDNESYGKQTSGNIAILGSRPTLQTKRDAVEPSMDSPSVIQGVWENNPAVVC